MQARVADLIPVSPATLQGLQHVDVQRSPFLPVPGIVAGPHNTLQRRHPRTGELVWTAQLTAPATEAYGPDGGEIEIWAPPTRGAWIAGGGWLPGPLRRLIGGGNGDEVVVASLGASLYALPAVSGTNSAAMTSAAAGGDGGGGAGALVPAKLQARRCGGLCCHWMCPSSGGTRSCFGNAGRRFCQAPQCTYAKGAFPFTLLLALAVVKGVLILFVYT